MSEAVNDTPKRLSKRTVAIVIAVVLVFSLVVIGLWRHVGNEASSSPSSQNSGDTGGAIKPDESETFRSVSNDGAKSEPDDKTYDGTDDELKAIFTEVSSESESERNG